MGPNCCRRGGSAVVEFGAPLMRKRTGTAARVAIMTSLCLVTLFNFAVSARASTVSYHGQLAEEAFGGGAGNLADDFVIAGTFRPGFDVSQYKFIYGSEGGNLFGLPHYTQAVAAGDFRPIGTNTLANAAGFFNGSGTTATNIDDLPIYIFAFDTPMPDPSFELALVSGTGPSWRVQSGGNTNIDVSTANVIRFGR
jgi:hypothetical protein